MARSCRKLITLEWIDKAEGDYITAQREARARKYPVFDVAWFHAQQCVEKYLKARLVEAGLAFGKTHNLSLVLPVEPAWRSLQPALNALNVYAVDYRYSGYSATKTEAQSALKNCRDVWRVIRQAFGLPV